jgi:hypothetical protein
LGGWSRVRRFIAIAAPLRGTNAALLSPFNPHVRDLSPTSELMRRLWHEPVDHPERIVCLSARFDELVPAWSSCLPKAMRVVIDVVGHNNPHRASKATYDTVAHYARSD